MDYKTSIRLLFEAVLLEGRTTGGDYEATGQRVGAFIGKKGNNTRRNRERADRIVDRLADKEYKDKGDEGGPVGAPFNKGFRKGYVDTVRQQYESSNNARRNLRALFEAVLNEEGFEYQKPGKLSKSKRNQAEYEDRREKELSGKVVMAGGGNLTDKHLMPHERASARGVRAIKADSPHSKDKYGNPRSVPDTHTSMELAHRKEDRAAKRAARERRLAAKAAKAAKAQQKK